MKNQDYDGAIIHMIDEIKDVVTPKTEEQIEQEDKKLEEFNKTARIGLAVVTGSFLVMIATLLFSPIFRHFNLLKRSKYDYKGDDKLTPDDYNFQENNTWTSERKNLFWKELYKKRSQYDYRGINKLSPGMPLFVMNDSWTQERVDDYKKRLKEDREDRLKRSDYNYKGKNKLYPNDSGFIENSTWTAILLSEYLRERNYHYSSGGYSSSSSSSYDSSSSSSSWSSGGWGGGGFDGGGSSGDW